MPRESRALCARVRSQRSPGREFDQREAAVLEREHPYALRHVQLEEGPRVLEPDPADVEIGKAVELTFQDDDDGWAIYRFKLV